MEKRIPTIGLFVCLLPWGCQISKPSDESSGLQGTSAQPPSISEVLTFRQGFGTSAPAETDLDRHLLEAGRLKLKADTTNNPIPQELLDSLRPAYGDVVADRLIASFGTANRRFAQALAHVDIQRLPAGVLAMAALAYGNPPVTYREPLSGPYRTPQATEIGGQHYVFAFPEEDALLSYYDCVRYSFLLTDAMDGVIDFGFDTAEQRAFSNGVMARFGQKYPNIKARNAMAVKLLAALHVRGIGYQPLRETPTAISQGLEGVDVPSLQVGDIMVYTPPGIHPLDEASDYWASARNHSSILLAYAALFNHIDHQQLTPEAILELSSDHAMDLIEQVVADRQKKDLPVFDWLNPQITLSQDEIDGLLRFALQVMVWETEGGKTVQRLEEQYGTYSRALAAMFVRNSGTLRTVRAMDSEGKSVDALLVHNIPAFHVAMITQIKDGMPYVFQIDGANPVIGASFEPLAKVIVPGSFITFLRKSVEGQD